jgi:hypothetical protein
VLTLDQNNSQVRPGMTATATVIIKQASGVTVSNQALSGSGTNATVQLLKNGKAVTQNVVVGLRGSSRSQIVSGLKAGDQLQVTITLPSLGGTSTSSSSSATSSATSGAAGVAGFGGAAGGFAGGGGFAARFGGG